MGESVTSNGDVILAANEPPYTPGAVPDDAGGDIVFKTGGVERARIKADGTGSGWPSVLGGSLSPIFNVKDLYGAKGDGSSDDTTAIQAALTAAAAAGGGIVYLPVGTYIVSATLLHPGKVVILGSGPESVIKGVFASGTAYIIKNDETVAVTDIELRDLTIDRSGANAQHACHYRNVNGLTIDRVRVVGVASATSGAIIVGGFTTPNVTDACSNVRVTRCFFSQTDNFAVQLAAVTNGVIANCLAEDCYREVFAVEPGTGVTASNITITGNVARQGTTKTAGSSSTGVIIVTESSGGTVRNVTVTGNTVTTSATIATDPSPGIAVYGCVDVSITGNSVYEANGAGIKIGNASFASSYILAVGNIVKDCNQGANSTPDDVGIAIRNSSKISVTDNLVSGAAHRLSVEETSSSASNFICNNLLLDAVGSVGTLGTNTVWFNNQTSSSSPTVTAAVSLVINDGKNIAVGTATGTKIGTATTQKVAFYNSTPVVQPATTGTTTGFTAGAGTTVVSGSTFTGNTGSAAYTIGDVVNALKKLGLLAA